MADYQPPKENVPIFDVANFIHDSNVGITESYANSKYLRKTVADTATAIESFTAGIVTPTVNSTGALTISGTGQNTNIGSTGIITLNGTVNATGLVGYAKTGSANTFSQLQTFNGNIKVNNSIETSNINSLIVNDVETDMTISNIDEFSSLSIGCYSERKGGINIYTSTITPVDNKVIIGHSLVTPSIARNTTELNSSDIYINNEIISDNNKKIVIGRTSGLFDTNTTINGKTTITKLTAGTLNTNTITNTAGNMTISPIATTASLLIGNATTTTDIQIGTIDGRSNHIHIGDGNNNVAGGGVHINNGLNNLSNVNILNGAGSTGTVTIGTTGTTTNLNGTVAVGGTLTGYAKLATQQTFTATQSFTGTLYGIACSRIRGITGQTLLSLFDEIVASTITIGNASTITMSGTTQCDTYDALTPTGGTMTVGNNATTTRINIGNSQTTGRLDIGQSGVRTGDIFIGGALSATTMGGAVTLGDSTKIQTIKGSTVNINSATAGNIVACTGTSTMTVGGSGLITDTINSSGVSTALTIGGNITDSYIAIGSGSVRTGGVSIHTTGMGNGGYVAIGSGANLTGSYVQVGSDSLPYQYIRAKNVEINTNALGNTNIGSAGYLTSVYGVFKLQNDLDASLKFQRNGTFNIGIDAGATPKLVLGVATGGNEVKINSLGTGTVYSNAGVLTNTNPSDETLKKNIVSIDVSIDNLNPVQYEWIDEKMGTGVKYGFLANEVVEIFPDICSTWKTDEEEVKLGMDTVSLIPIMVSAMKKMKLDYETKISKLEERLLALESKSTG